MLTAEFCARTAPVSIERALTFLRDPHAAAREYAVECASELTGRADVLAIFREVDYPYSLGTAIATVGSLLDSLGYPIQGPSVDQRSWLPDDDDVD